METGAARPVQAEENSTSECSGPRRRPGAAGSRDCGERLRERPRERTLSDQLSAVHLLALGFVDFSAVILRAGSTFGSSTILSELGIRVGWGEGHNRQSQGEFPCTLCTQRV